MYMNFATNTPKSENRNACLAGSDACLMNNVPFRLFHVFLKEVQQRLEIPTIPSVMFR